jgi:hypothetical protein
VNSTAGSPAPLYTGGSGNNYLSPADYATIYNANPLYPAITGAGTTIAVLGRSNINIQDVIAFRSLMGLPANPPHIILNGPDPGDLGGGEEAEAVLDTSWAGALATAASVDLIVSQTTHATDGVDLSELYVINNNLANVMTESFGACEAAFTPAQEALISSNAQQAAAQGISYTVSSGDAGSAGCDLFNIEETAGGPISPNGLSSTPYTLSVGGTQFNENGAPSLYWRPANAANLSSALSYIPEDVWNVNCLGPVCGTGRILASGGAPSQYFSKPSWQSGVTGIPADGMRDTPDVSLTAAGHDPYIVCLAGSCSGSVGFFYTVYGTSASAPAFASIIALINQKTGTRLGQLAPRLYALASAENLNGCDASNTATLPAANCIFNDVTVGTNAVPGEANYNTPAETFPAKVGYDLATGLGSVNIANLVNAWGGGPVAAGPIAALSPTSLTFPGPSGGAPQVVTLSNTGSAALSIANIAVSGANASDFAASHNCGTVLSAAGSCAISVTFNPTASGARTASLVVTDNSGNAPGSTQTAGLTGNSAAAPGGSASAAYLGTDASTQGTWTGKYGLDGQLIANAANNAPSYATVAFTSAATWTWAPSTTEPRAVQTSSGSSTRIASTYYSGGFTVDVNLTDGNAHKISLYLCDYDRANRAETVSILDATSKAVLSTQSFSSFAGGVYGMWNIKGHVQIQVTRNAGINALVNALFFDTAGSGPPPPGGSTAAAAYAGPDTATQGSWTGKYGADGQMIANSLNNPASYANVAFSGSSTWTWAESTTDPRAIQVARGSYTRMSSTYYANGFTIDLNLTDGNTHKISLYLCDWDHGDRAETISIVDAASKAVLSTQSFSAFVNGVYGVWNIKGHVQIQVARNAGSNAIVNAVFVN